MRTLLPAWVLLSVPVVAGWGVMFWGGAPAARWGLHLVAAAVGLLVYVGGTRSLSRRLNGAVVGVGMAAAVATIAATLLSPGISGIHRWHEIGSLLVHPSALLAPTILMVAAAHITGHPLLGHTILAGVQVVHVLQPDAGQATAFGAAAIILLATKCPGAPGRVMMLAHTALVAAAWMRPDPLPPAPFVEDIVVRAFALAPMAGVVAMLSVIPFVLAPRLGARGDARSAGDGAAEVTLIFYFAGSLIAPVFGEFPIPMLGFGPSPVVGGFLGLAALQRLRSGSVDPALDELRGSKEQPSADGVSERTLMLPLP